MKYIHFSILVAILGSFCALPHSAKAYDLPLTQRMFGRILLQVQAHGEAWYVRSSDSLRYYMKDGDAAYQMMRNFSQGITDADLAKIPSVASTTTMNQSTSVCATNVLANRLKGRILLQVQQHGEAWYVHPVKCRTIYMADGAAAYEIMRYLGFGITNSDLEKIKVGEIIGIAPTDRADVLLVLKANASRQWGDNYQMVKYEYDNQVEAYDWVMAQTAYPEIMAKAKQQWGTNYEMVKYEYNNQVEAYESL